MTSHLDKVLLWDQALYRIEALRRENKAFKVVFTNGCFDILHAGHVRYLAEARALGDFLVVGLNSDSSIRLIKTPPRPITNQDQRAEVLAGLGVVDAVVVFDQPDPVKLIALLGPDVLVKGGDWPVDKIKGREIVEQRGGRVLSIPLLPDVSTTGIIDRILRLYKDYQPI